MLTAVWPRQVMKKFASIQLLTWEASLRNALPWKTLHDWSQKVRYLGMWRNLDLSGNL